MSGLVIHDSRWEKYLHQIINFRRRLQRKYKLKIDVEIHASELIRKPLKKYSAIPNPNDRSDIILAFAKELAKMHDINIINVVVDKANKNENFPIFDTAWKALIQSFENGLLHGHFRGSAEKNQRGIIFPDTGSKDKKLRQLMKELCPSKIMSVDTAYGIEHQHLNINLIIEELNFHNSSESFYVQAADLAAYLLCQKLQPGTRMRRISGKDYFSVLDCILCKECCTENKEGIVWL